MKRIISMLMVLIMVITLMPLSVFADTTPVISVTSTSAQPGSTVTANVEIKNNPGVISTSLAFSFPDCLTLVGATAGDAFSALSMTPPAQLSRGETIKGSCRFAWFSSDIAESDIKDGVILTLEFAVSEDAVLNEDYAIKVSCTNGDTIGKDGNPMPLATENGFLTIIDYTPGDVNKDGHINMTDVVRVSRYIVDGCQFDPNGYAVSIKEEAADVNADGRINMQDVVMISRYIVDGCITDPFGYNIKLLPGLRICSHSLEAVAAKEATCEEAGNIAYWHCTKCDKYYTDDEGKGRIALEDAVIDALGHNGIADDGTPATPTAPGYTSGVWCDRCETWISGHERIDPIAPNESNISYRHYVRTINKDGSVEIANDSYLSSHEIVNPNPNTYIEGVGIKELVEGVAINGKQVTANGYRFLGWYEKPETTAKRVYSISADETGDKVLYGLWSKEEYTITYLPDSANSTIQKVMEETYTVDKETALKVPTWENLVWIGWSDENGNIVKSIPKGSAGNITLTANWMSRRNQTVPKTNYAKDIPAFYADEENGIYTFTYEIGEIQNVPIQQVADEATGEKSFNLVKGATRQINSSITEKVEEGEAQNVANTIAKATVKSDSWTLSEDWSKSSSFSQEHSSEVTREQSQKASQSFSETNKFALSSGKGGTTEHIDENGNSSKTTKTNEFGVSVNVGVEAGIKAGITAPTPFKNGKVSADLGLDYKHSKEETEENYEKHTDKTTSTWNTSKSFENSATMSETNEFSNSISQSIRDTKVYGETLEYGGSNSKTVSSSNTSSESREYSSSVSYSTETGKTISVSETLTGDADTGFYRKVLAANFKVFAVVIYDMKENSFSTMTYSLKVKDSEHLFTDYSTVSSFNDYENGVLPFSVPSYVSEYVYSLVGGSDGLKIDPDTGIVAQYGYKDPKTGVCYKKYDDSTGIYSEPCDTDVVIPQYTVINVDGTHKKIVKVTGVEASAFKGTNITTVYLNNGITSIPKGAFENCTDLKYIRGGDVSSIAAEAFKNCTSLEEICLSSNVTTLGTDAFVGDNALSISPATPEILDAAINSGVKELSVDLSDMKGTISGFNIVTPESMERFSLSGGGNAYSNLSISSDADEVALYNITINNSSNAPLKLSGSKLILGYVTITSSGLVLKLEAEKTNIILDGNNYITSNGENASLSRSLTISDNAESSAIGKLVVSGNALVFGSVTGGQYVSFVRDATDFVYLTDSEYNNYLKSVNVKFDANGGTVALESKSVLWNTALGTLPVPTRDYFTFDGWYTAAEGGERADEDKIISAVGEVTLYAHWKLNDAVGWILKSKMPEGAELLDTKFVYDLETTDGSKTGYTNKTEKWSEYGSWSSWSKTKVTASDSRKVDTRPVAATYKTEYNYSRWTEKDGSNGYGWNGPSKGTWSGHYCGYYFERGWGSQLPVYQSDIPSYGASGNVWYNQTTRQSVVTAAYTEYRYCDRHKIYTYTFESAQKPSGTGVSNVQEYVMYRPK